MRRNGNILKTFGNLHCKNILHLRKKEMKNPKKIPKERKVVKIIPRIKNRQNNSHRKIK